MLEQEPCGYISPDPARRGEKFNYAEMLGVVKYEEEEHGGNSGSSGRGLPAYLHKYDIESCQNHKAASEKLMDQLCYITEKVEGTHCSLTWKEDEDEPLVLCSRRQVIELSPDGGSWWEAGVSSLGLRELMPEIAKYLGSKFVTVRGEVIGPNIQSNIYERTKKEMLLFDIEVDGKPLPAPTFVGVCARFGLPDVPLLSGPILLRDFVEQNGGTLAKASHGMSRLNPKVMREGIVIKPVEEQTFRGIGRLMLKYRDPEYLAWFK